MSAVILRLGDTGPGVTEVRERLAELGFEPNRNTPAAFAELIKTDIQKWGRVVRESGARAD